MHALSRHFYCALIVLLLSGCHSEVGPEDVSNVSVTFVEPEKFTDVRRTEWEHNSPTLLAALAKFMQDTGERTLPPDMTLFIKVTDVKLAGDFEPWLGPPFNQTRIIKSVYPPHITLEFELVDNTGKIVKSGKRNLTDIDYQLRSVYPRDDYLRYEKDILRDWLRGKFGGVRTEQSAPR